MTTPIRLGPLLLSHPIGSGGVGSVWRAQHPEGVLVAVKLLQERFAADPRLLEVFRFEVSAVASLDHPAIVRVYDYGVVPEEAAAASRGMIAAGAPWLAMELADGGTFAERRPVTSWDELSPIVLHLLDGLAHSHARGLVHRDLKPQNVLVRKDGPAALTDFGIAHALTRGSPSSAAAGTPGYMAPEQVLGRIHDMGPWTDLYALGSVIFELVAGRPAFVGDTREAVFRQQLQQDVSPLPAPFELPPGGSAWLARMLDRKPRRRFRCAADAAHAFRLLDAHPALPPPLPEDWRTAHAPTTERPKGTGLALFVLRPWPLVGRSLQQDELWQALREVRETGRPRGVLISGEAGVGKTRLARWLAERVHETGAAEVVWIRHCGRDPGLLAALTNHLQVKGLDREDTAHRLKIWLQQTGDLESETHAATFAELLHPPVGRIPAPDDWVPLLRALAIQRPLVFVVDDVDRALDALQVAEQLLDVDWPVLVVTAANPDLLRPPRTTLIQALRARSLTIDIAALPDGLQREFLDKGTGLSPRLARSLVARTRGNPLYAVEAVIDWARRELLVPTSTGFDLGQAAAPRVPRSILHVLEVRLEPVAAQHPTAPHALELLAALGGERIRESDWNDAADEYGIELPEPLLTALSTSGLAQTSNRPGAPRRWTLSHRLFRDALIQLATQHQRHSGLHGAAGRAMLTQERSSAQDSRSATSRRGGTARRGGRRNREVDVRRNIGGAPHVAACRREAPARTAGARRARPTPRPPC